METQTCVTMASVAVLSCAGRLNMAAASALNSSINDLLAAGHTRIVVDLANVSSIDSSCLGALIAGLKKARHVNGDLRISGAQSAVLAVLSLTNLDRVLPNHETVELAAADW